MEEYSGSGLSLKALCQQHHPDRETLTRRLQQLESPSASNAQTPGWVRVELTPERDPVSVAAAGGVALVVTIGRRTEPARHFDAATLRQHLRLLGSP